MTFNILNRKIHYWASAVIAVPALVLIGSGLLLQSKKHWTWVQPAEQRGTGSSPVIDLEGVLTSLKSVEGMDVRTWADVNRLDVRPSRGVVKAWLQNGFEVQVDLGTGRVLQTEYRRSDLLESIHDGSYFGGDVTKLGVFLPTGLVIFLLWATGLWMWWVPFAARRRARARGSVKRAVPGLPEPQGDS